MRNVDAGNEIYTVSNYDASLRRLLPRPGVATRSACGPTCLGTGAKLLSRGTGFGLAHSHAATPSSQQRTD